MKKKKIDYNFPKETCIRIAERGWKRMPVLSDWISHGPVQVKDALRDPRILCITSTRAREGLEWRRTVS